MKAPDKIIVAPHQIFDNDLDTQEVGHNGAMEYIRKDALLEWANEQYKHLDGTTIKNPDSPYWGQMVAFQQVIEKLNSL